MSWKGLSELAANLTDAEVRFEKQRRLFGLIAGPTAFFVCVVAPPVPDVTEVGMRTLGIFLWTVLWWVCEPIPIPTTSFLAMALLIFCGVQTVTEGFATWANWINIFLLASMIIGHATSVHGLTKRIAYRMVASPVVAANPWRLLLLIGWGVAIMSSMMSHVVTTMLFLSIASGLAEALEFKKYPRYAEALFLSIAWGSNLGIATPVGTPPNLIAISFAQQLGYRIGFLEWIVACLPVFLLSMMAVFLVIRFVLRPEMPRWDVTPEYVREQLYRLGPMTRGEKIAGGVFLTAIFLWMLPDLVPLTIDAMQKLGVTGTAGAMHPWTVWLRRHLDWSVSAVFMATALFLIPVDWKKREFAMNWDTAVKGIEWGTLALIAAALALGGAIASPTVGLGKFLGAAVTSLTATGASQLIFVFVLVSFTIIVGSFISNIAIIGMVGAIVLAIPTGTVNPIALMVSVGMAASFDFALPIGTPPSAMVFASGYVRIWTMAKAGAILSLIGIVIVSLIGFYTVNWVMPWPPR
jgi:solute carrier family 13 (sodium-dependent dicarboxylate transporter), member 2/3/5